jgi:hypothetical protein
MRSTAAVASVAAVAALAVVLGEKRCEWIAIIFCMSSCMLRIHFLMNSCICNAH